MAIFITIGFCFVALQLRNSYMRRNTSLNSAFLESLRLCTLLVGNARSPCLARISEFMV
jgi:hypothetical protein